MLQQNAIVLFTKRSFVTPKMNRDRYDLYTYIKMIRMTRQVESGDYKNLDVLINFGTRISCHCWKAGIVDGCNWIIATRTKCR